MRGYFARFSESQPRYAVHGKDENIFFGDNAPMQTSAPTR